MTKRWWRFWKCGHHTAGKIFVHGYFVTPGSQLHRRAVGALRLRPDEKLEQDVNVHLPAGEIIERLAQEWTVLGRGVVSDDQLRSMHRREKEIGQVLYELGGIDLMKQFALKLIYAGLSYESDFAEWHGIGPWQR